MCEYYEIIVLKFVEKSPTLYDNSVHMPIMVR